MLLPLLARLDLDAVVKRCAFPGTKMIPAAHAVRAALLLKLLGKSRRSHVMDLVFDPGVALAAGLNAIPKATFMSQYSSRLGRKALVRLLGAWIEKLRDEKLVDASSFDLDFHSISYFGEDPFVEKHYVPRRSQRRKAVLAFLARDAGGNVFCYSNTDIRKGEEADEVLRFVKFWEQRYGEHHQHLVFDSKLTTHANLSTLHNELEVTFVTLRRRSPKLMAEIATLPRSAWRTVHLDVPHRKFKTPRVVDQRIQLRSFKGTLRQLLIRDLGHDEPTILLTNDLTSSLKAVITRYARRMLTSHRERSGRQRGLLPPRLAVFRRRSECRFRRAPDRHRQWHLPPVPPSTLHGYERARAPGKSSGVSFDTTARVAISGTSGPRDRPTASPGTQPDPARRRSHRNDDHDTLVGRMPPHGRGRVTAPWPRPSRALSVNRSGGVKIQANSAIQLSVCVVTPRACARVAPTPPATDRGRSRRIPKEHGHTTTIRRVARHPGTDGDPADQRGRTARLFGSRCRARCSTLVPRSTPL